jgi:dTDP-4-amino-4,6-dideoxygalactose transaminase
LIPLAEPELGGNEARYLLECVESGFVSSVGPLVERFEAGVARACGATGAVATNTGTAGLHAALVALGVGSGDLVIVPSYTFVATANAVVQAGARPWLLDVDPRSWTLDPLRVRAALERETRAASGRRVHAQTGLRVAALLPVHAFGLPAEMDRLAELAREFGLALVADAAAALGADFRGAPLAELADLSVFSFNGNKTVTAGGGGAVTGADAALLERVRHLTTTARAGAEYLHDEAAFNYRMTNLQAAVGCAQLERLDALLARKRAVRERYDRALADLPRVRPFPDPGWGRSACWLSGLLLDGSSAPDADRLGARLGERGIGARAFWRPLHAQPAHRDAPRTADLRVSEALSRGVLVLPSSSGLTSEDQLRVIDALRAELSAGGTRSRISSSARSGVEASTSK